MINKNLKVNFVSRDAAITLIKGGVFYNEDVDFLSISDTEEEAVFMEKMFNAMYGQRDLFDSSRGNLIQTFVFKDLNGDESDFTPEMAKDIIDFIEQTAASGKELVVHCFAGISRSGAVAKFASEYFGSNAFENYVGYNIDVYNTLVETYGEETLRSYYNKLSNI